MALAVVQPDVQLSPMTGMGRRHWIEAGKYLLEGVFRHVRGPGAPIALPKQPGKTYPQPDDPPWKHRAAEFEGLARTFMIAAPLIAEHPEISVAGYSLRHYYADQILRATDPAAPQYLGKISEMSVQYKTPLFQHTAEGAALCLGLLMSRKVIWDSYTKAQKNQVAEVLGDYAHAMTNAHNWRWFNVMMGSFLIDNGYEVDRTMLMDHLHNLLAYYAGDGWYRDGKEFDFYSAWAFQFYGPLWCDFYGYQREPEIAAVIDAHHRELQKTYPMLFGRNGHSLMWGRSIMYRCAASAPLVSAFLLKQPLLDPGWARRIASGNLLQFVSRDDLLCDGAPALGFYGTFEPLVQSYSCAASPFWLAKIFAALYLPADSPFWTAKENEGNWPAIGDGQQTVVLNGPGLTLTQHGKTGAAELRPGKAPAAKSNPSYTRLVYNTHFPGEEDNPAGATASAYSIRHLGVQMPFMCHSNMRFCGHAGGVLYRQIDIPGWMSHMSLADIVIPGGVIRVDRLSIAIAHELRLGHLPIAHVDGVAATVVKKQIDGRPAIIARGAGRSVAMVAWRSWDAVDAEVHEKLNAEAPTSTVVYARRQRKTNYSGMDLAVCVMLHRTGEKPFTDADLSPIAAMEYLDLAPSGAPAGLRLELKDGQKFLVDFKEVMGRWGI